MVACTSNFCSIFFVTELKIPTLCMAPFQHTLARKVGSSTEEKGSHASVLDCQLRWKVTPRNDGAYERKLERNTKCTSVAQPCRLGQY